MLQLLCNTSGKADNLNANTSVITGFYLYACLKDSIMVRCGYEDRAINGQMQRYLGISG